MWKFYNPVYSTSYVVMDAPSQAMRVFSCDTLFVIGPTSHKKLLLLL